MSRRGSSPDPFEASGGGGGSAQVVTEDLRMGQEEKEELKEEVVRGGTRVQRGAPPRRLSTRLSFNDKDIHIPGSPKKEGAKEEQQQGRDIEQSTHSQHKSTGGGKSLFQTMVSSVIGSSAAPKAGEMDRSLSNTIRVSTTSRVDMSVFEQKKGTNTWASTGVTLGTDNLSYFVSKGKGMFGRGPEERKTLLKHVTMAVHPGEVAYVMGPSGAGKSTLLDVLAGRVKQGIMSGSVVFNGQARSQSFWDNSAYVKQDDVHIPTLTVFETLTFAARLRLGNEYEEEERQVRVSTIAELLGLTACQFSPVGDASLRGISGGQLKRLSIAVEIVNMPSLIFLDEPTSGLDSVMSYEVMSFTSRLAEQNRTIVATIHQPSTETFMLSNKVILVSAGRVVYCGPTAEVVSYFTSPALGYRYDGRSNPADFAIAVVSGAETSAQADLRDEANPKVLADRYEASAYFKPPVIAKAKDGSTPKQVGSEPARFKTSTFSQTMVLLNRFWITLIRQREFLQAHIMKNIIVAATCGVIFWMQGKEEAYPHFSNSSFNVSSLWYFAMLYTILSNLQIIPQLFFFRVIYTRERSAQVYSTFAYWASMAIVNLPLLFFSHAIFVSIAYWMIGVSPVVGDHLFAVFLTFMNNLVAFYSAQLLAAVCSSAEIALALFPVTFLFLGSFAGFSIPLSELPPAWKWASYISYPRWTYQGLIINEFRHRADNTAVLDFYSFQDFNKYYCFPILLSFILVMNVGVYLALLPAKTKLRVEEPSDPAQSPKPEAPPAVIVIDPLPTPTSSVMQLEDFRQRSSNRIPITPGVSLIFRNLEYSIGSSKEKAKRILKGVSGQVAPGQMCALMGGSGAGKSTLLDLLAYRKTSGFITGEYYLNGKPDKPATKWCSYVTQDNVHIGCFTVRETLEFAVLLRLEEGTSREKRMERAQNVMEMLGLEGVADVIVGDALNKGISGGQARRLSIGVEIVQLPDVIFLDEPTTGLDSQISYEVMASVRNIANHNRTVVCTIHSPSESVFRLFDSLILLALGRQTYFGSVGEAVDYFARPPIGWHMAPGKNPADFVMEASQGLLSTSEGATHTVRDLNNIFLSSDNYKAVDGLIERTLAVNLSNTQRAQGNGGRRVRTDSVLTAFDRVDYPRSLASQIRILAYRQMLKLSKMRRPLIAASIRNIVIAVFHGSLYYHMRGDAIQSRLSLLFFAIMLVMMSNQQFIPNVFEDRLLFYRERGAGVYGSLPYWMVSSLPYIPQQVGASLVYSAVVYHLANLHSGREFFWYFALIVGMSSLCGLFFCQLLAFSTPSPQMAVSIFPAALFLIIAFAGFVVRLPSLPNWLGVWAPKISFARWAFQGLVINEFRGNGKVDYGVIVPAYVTDKYALFIENFGFEGFDKWASVPILAISIGVLWVLCFLPIRYISFEKR